MLAGTDSNPNVPSEFREFVPLLAANGSAPLWMKTDRLLNGEPCTFVTGSRSSELIE